MDIIDMKNGQLQISRLIQSSTRNLFIQELKIEKIELQVQEYNISSYIQY